MRFEDYVAEYGQALLRLAYVLDGDGQRAEDLTQSVLAEAYRHWRKVSAARSPDAYVRRMLANAHLDWHRRGSSTERPTDLREHELAVQTDPAEEVVSRDELRQALVRLAPRARTVLVLRYYADLDDGAISEVLGVSPSTVRATASRALTALRVGGLVNPVDTVEGRS